MARPLQKPRNIRHVPTPLMDELRKAGVNGLVGAISPEGLTAHANRPVQLLRRGWDLWHDDRGSACGWCIGERNLGQRVLVDRILKRVILETEVRGYVHRLSASMREQAFLEVS